MRGLLALFALTLLTGGIPTVLARLVGWPLPDHLPTLGDLGTWFTTPLSDEAIINLLACACWVAWALLTRDVLGLLAYYARRRPIPNVHRGVGPLHALATALVGAVVIAVLATRPTPNAEPPATATAATPTTGSAGAEAGQLEPGTCLVRPPQRGVYDSLWRIAERELGDGHRWPELYQLNRGRPQPDGRTLTSPDLIHPGWVLRLPAPAQPPADQPPPENPPPPTTTAPDSPSTTTPPPASTTATDPSPTTPATSVPIREGTPGTNVQLRPGVVAGTTLAAITAAAMIAAGLHRRRGRRDRAKRRAESAPIVRRLADLTAADLRADLVSGPEPPAQPALPASDTGPAPEAEADIELGILPGCAAPAEIAIGHRDGHELVWDLACGTGLGLIGPGALPAARALLTTLLGAGGPGHTLDQVHVVTTRADATALLGTDPPTGLTRLTITDTLDAAIEHVEAEQLARLRTLDMLDLPTADHIRRTHPPETLPRLVLLATPTPDTANRLQGLLDGGPTVAVSGLLLGAWPAGTTCRVHADGTIGTAIDPTGTGVPDLHGVRLFQLDQPAATDLLALLHAAQPDPHPDPDADPRPDTEPTSEARPAPSTEPSDPVLRVVTLGRLAALRPGRDRDLLGRVGRLPRLLLALLCLHQRGVTLPEATVALWPGVEADKAAVRWHATLSQLRKALGHITDEFAVIYRDSRYQLHPATGVDLWTLHEAQATAQQTGLPDDQHQTALHTITTTYTGPLLPDLDALWLDAPREAARRTAIDALVALARHAQHHDPDQALALLDRAISHDPHDEALYRHIMRLQARLGRTDAITRTHRLLAARLAELDLHPEPATTRLLAELTDPGRR